MFQWFQCWWWWWCMSCLRHPKCLCLFLLRLLFNWAGLRTLPSCFAGWLFSLLSFFLIQMRQMERILLGKYFHWPREEREREREREREIERERKEARRKNRIKRRTSCREESHYASFLFWRSFTMKERKARKDTWPCFSTFTQLLLTQDATEQTEEGESQRKWEWEK